VRKRAEEFINCPYNEKTVPKIKIVILKPAKNLLFFFLNQKIKKEILRLTASG
jgi:hypothetical protein